MRKNIIMLLWFLVTIMCFANEFDYSKTSNEIFEENGSDGVWMEDSNELIYNYESLFGCDASFQYRFDNNMLSHVNIIPVIPHSDDIFDPTKTYQLFLYFCSKYQEQFGSPTKSSVEIVSFSATEMKESFDNFFIKNEFLIAEWNLLDEKIEVILQKQSFFIYTSVRYSAP